MRNFRNIIAKKNPTLQRKFRKIIAKFRYSIVDAIFAIVLRNFGEFFYGCRGDFFIWKIPQQNSFSSSGRTNLPSPIVFFLRSEICDFSPRGALTPLRLKRSNLDYAIDRICKFCYSSNLSSLFLQKRAKNEREPESKILNEIHNIFLSIEVSIHCNKNCDFFYSNAKNLYFWSGFCGLRSWNFYYSWNQDLL